MSDHRTLIIVTIATLIFSAVSFAADRIGPRGKTPPAAHQEPGHRR